MKNKKLVFGMFVLLSTVSSVGMAADSKSEFGDKVHYATIGGTDFNSETGKDTRRFFDSNELYTSGASSDGLISFDGIQCQFNRLCGQLDRTVSARGRHWRVW